MVRIKTSTIIKKMFLKVYFSYVDIVGRCSTLYKNILIIANIADVGKCTQWLQDIVIQFEINKQKII